MAIQGWLDWRRLCLKLDYESFPRFPLEVREAYRIRQKIRRFLAMHHPPWRQHKENLGQLHSFRSYDSKGGIW